MSKPDKIRHCAECAYRVREPGTDNHYCTRKPDDWTMLGDNIDVEYMTCSRFELAATAKRSAAEKFFIKMPVMAAAAVAACLGFEIARSTLNAMGLFSYILQLWMLIGCAVLLHNLHSHRPLDLWHLYAWPAVLFRRFRAWRLSRITYDD